MRQSNYPRGRVFSTPPPEFETVEFRLDPVKFENLYAGAFTISHALQIFIYGIVISGVLDVVAQLGKPEDRTPYVFWMGVFLTIGYIVSYRFRLRRAVRRQAGDQNSSFLYSDYRCVISAEGRLRLELESGWITETPWTLVQRVEQTDEWINISVGQASTFYVPKAAFSDQSVVEGILKFASAEKLT